jgi:TolA-binding protein
VTETVPTVPPQAHPRPKHSTALVETSPANELVEPIEQETTRPSEAPAPAPPSVFIAVKAPAPAEATETAASIFDAANEARRKGDYARAVSLDRRLQITYPSSREAHVSYATVGRLLLDRGDAAAALASFDRYQARGGGALDEPVLVGRATALERLGRPDEARMAWATLLSSFPDTPYAEHARMRVDGTRLR